MIGALKERIGGVKDDDEILNSVGKVHYQYAIQAARDCSSQIKSHLHRAWNYK